MSRKRPKPSYLCHCGDHAWCVLSKGFVVLVSPRDKHFLEERSWRWVRQYTPYSKTGYAQSGASGEEYAALHRVIMKVNDRKISVDHINGHGEDCRRPNLRIASHQQNCRNQRSHGDSNSKYVGVHYVKKREKFMSYIQIRPKREGSCQITLGYFDSEEEAAKVRDEASLKYFGKFARLNFPPP